MKKMIVAFAVLTAVLFGGDFQDGLKAYVNKDYKKAVELFQKSADEGDARAQFILGTMYNEGKGVKQEYKKAVEFYQKSANQGHAEAQLNLGFMYYNGQGVKKDKIKAYHWWMKAAKQGIPQAQKNLDVLCRQSPWACKK